MFEQTEEIKNAQTSAAAGFIAGLSSTLKVENIQDIPHLLNPVTGELKSLEHLLARPARQHTTRRLLTLEDFCEYVKRFKKPASSIYVLTEGNGFTIVAEIDHRSETETAWTDHVVSFVLQPSESIIRWKAENKKRMSQEAFAELLEERMQDIAVPAAGEILDIARSLHVTRNLSVKTCVRTRDGGNSLAFNVADGIKAGEDGTVDIPTEFKINLAPFARHRESVQVRALLRTKIYDERPSFVYDLQLLDESIEEVLDGIISAIRTQTSLPVYR